MSSDLTLGKTLLRNDFVQIVALVPVDASPPEIKEEKVVAPPIKEEQQLCYQLRPNHYQCGLIGTRGSHPGNFTISPLLSRKEEAPR